MFPDGNAFMTGSDDTTCRLFDIRSDGQVNVFQDRQTTTPVTTLEFSPSGRVLFASYEGGSLCAWDVLKGTFMGDMLRNNNPSGQITSIQVSNDGSRIYTSSWDSMVSTTSRPH